jgi:hypothetical protein
MVEGFVSTCSPCSISGITLLCSATKDSQISGRALEIHQKLQVSPKTKRRDVGLWAKLVPKSLMTNSQFVGWLGIGVRRTKSALSSRLRRTVSSRSSSDSGKIL